MHTRPGGPAGSVGFLNPNTRLKVVDPVTGEELGENKDGELLIKGSHVTKGYFRNPEANRIAFDTEGWFRTGDIGHYDEYGIIFLVGRLKELIKYKGFQVSPAELENLISSHPKVSDVGVVGIKDDEAGEVPKAFVVRKDSSLTEKEVSDFVKDRVSKYKHLRGGVEFVGEIPKNDTGKILRRKLMERDAVKSRM
uniref:4-coumarate--CoA ligase 1-like n=1 Tax=Phallusia mammillata TaxID=59560 RepID=A0A6F9D688_9ASCI|nr:4-coumarate--CoA ligase 1-like [Phallusia mammillata]